MLKFCKNEDSKNIVLCHNDLNLSNILLSKNDDVILLDYEYANFNSIFYDWGNFFGETNFKLIDKEPFFIYHSGNVD